MTPTLSAPSKRRPMSNESIEELVVMLLRIRAVRREAIRLLEPSHFSKAQELYLAALWAEVLRLHVLHPDGEAIPYVVLHDACRDAAYAPGSMLDEVQARNLLDTPETIPRDDPTDAGLPGMLYHAYYLVPDDRLDRDFGMALLRRFVIERAAAEPITRQVEIANRTGMILTDFGALLEGSRRVTAQVEQIDRSRSRSLLRDLDEVRPLATCPTGLSFLDQFMGGGPAPSEIWGVMAPTGGGKSTLFGQLLAERSKVFLHQHQKESAPPKTAFLFTFEENYDRMWDRAIAHLANVTKKEIERGSADFSTRGHLKEYERALFGADADGERERIEAMMIATAPYLRIHDMSADGAGGVDAIVERLEHDIEVEGLIPGCVLIDSLNLLVAGSLGPNVRDFNAAFAARMTSVVAELRARVGARFGVDVGVTNQTAGRLAKRSTATLVSHSEGAGSTTWAQACDFAFAIGNMSADKVALFICSKSRRTRYTDEYGLMRLDGPFARWLNATSEFVVHKGEITRKSTSDMMVAPATRRRDDTATDISEIDDDDDDDAISAPKDIRQMRTN